jgi:phosphatidylglycerol:prolipoprotein diacylglycerol transferase
MIGTMVASLIFMRRRKLSPNWHGPDLVALAAPPGLFLGRMANFINGELWGKPVANQATPPWWSIKYPDEILGGQLDLESIDAVIPGNDTFLSNVVELTRQGEPTVINVVVPQLTAFYPSQLFQALSDGPILMLVLIAVWWVPRKAGVVTGTFLLTYGVLRVITEVFRQPDEGVALLAGLSRGQALSVIMIVAGLVVVVLASRSTGPRLGGLGRRPNLSGTVKQ